MDADVGELREAQQRRARRDPRMDRRLEEQPERAFVLGQLAYARERLGRPRRQRGDDRAEGEHDDDGPRIARRARPRAIRRHAGTLGHPRD
ncbi:MAG TPA: hypothetical protein VF080_05210 [Solirubrobacteraceae bacterium]